jgi:hypothetical protein
MPFSFFTPNTKAKPNVLTVFLETSWSTLVITALFIDNSIWQKQYYRYDYPFFSDLRQ